MLSAGTRLDNYEIIRQLGAGGMGEVWLATDLRLQRQVALKLLPPELTADPTRVKRFEQEARAASALNHPNVCTIHALGITDDGRHFIAMEHVEGDTLRDRITGGPLKRTEVLDIAIQIASALATAHAAGVVHRDLKPENAMLRRDGFVKVLDFGLVKLVAVESDPALPTRTVLHTDAGTAVGTVSYMSPEQARGQSVDARTDIWALGVVLYEMIAGRRPFAGQSTSDVLAAILEHEPAPLVRFDPEISRELQRIVAKALRKDPEERYQVMKDLLLDLKALRDDLFSAERSPAPSLPQMTTASFESGQGVGAPAANIQAPPRRWVRSAVIAAVIAALAVAAGWLGYTRTGMGRARTAASHTGPAPLIERPLTKLTSGRGLQTDVTWSPDGRFIAYASDQAGSFDIWVQPVGGGDAVQITKAPSQETQPDWSPDGSTIVYHSDRGGGGIYAVPALGGPEAQLTSFGAHPKWSADGSEALLMAGSHILAYGPAAIGLYSVPRQGGQPVPLASEFLARGQGWYWVASHPDGRISALGRHEDLGFGFFTVGRKGGKPVVSALPANFPLRRDVQGLTSARFQWNTAGTALIFELESYGIRHLWKAVIDPATLDIISMDRLTTGPSRDTGAAWSRDGTRLAYAAQNELARLWLYPFDSVGGRITSQGKPVTEESARACCAHLSDDGRWLTYGLNHQGSGASELWLLDLARGGRELVTKQVDAWSWTGGALSPDASTIAYTRLHFDRQGGGIDEAVPMLHSRGGGERAIGASNTSAVFFAKAWTSGGHALVGSLMPMRNAGPATLVLWPITHADATSPDRVIVQEREASIWEGSISPNGRWIVFEVNRQSRPGPSEIVIAPFDTPSRDRWIRVAPDHEWPDKPRWAPDGRTLYFISRHSGAYFNLWGVRVDPAAGTLLSEPFAITRNDSPALIISPDVSNTEIAVGERHLVLTMQSTTGNLWMLQNVDR